MKTSYSTNKLHKETREIPPSMPHVNMSTAIFSTTLNTIFMAVQMARGQIDLAGNIKKMLTSSTPVVGPTTTISIDPMSEVTRAAEHNLLPMPLTQPMVSFAPLKTAEEDNKKAAAAVAAKLAASTSSALMLTSVLSSLVAEEAASMNGSLNSTSGFSSGSIFPPGKRPKLEKPMSVSDVSNSDTSSSTFVSSSSTSMQAPFGPPPPQPPSQYVQSGVMVGVMPYGYGVSSLPPPPPLPHHIAMGLSRPISQPPQQQPTTGGYYQQPGLGFYGQGSQSATPPVPRQ